MAEDKSRERDPDTSGTASCSNFNASSGSTTITETEQVPVPQVKKQSLKPTKKQNPKFVYCFKINLIIGQFLQEPVSARLVLHLKKPKAKKKVDFTTGTVDNESLNKKKSKCKCQLDDPTKPRGS